MNELFSITINSKDQIYNMINDKISQILPQIKKLYENIDDIKIDQKPINVHLVHSTAKKKVAKNNYRYIFHIRIHSNNPLSVSSILILYFIIRCILEIFVSQTQLVTNFTIENSSFSIIKQYQNQRSLPKSKIDPNISTVQKQQWIKALEQQNLLDYLNQNYTPSQIYNNRGSSSIQSPIQSRTQSRKVMQSRKGSFESSQFLKQFEKMIKEQKQKQSKQKSLKESQKRLTQPQLGKKQTREVRRNPPRRRTNPDWLSNYMAGSGQK